MFKAKTTKLLAYTSLHVILPLREAVARHAICRLDLTKHM